LARLYHTKGGQLLVCQILGLAGPGNKGKAAETHRAHGLDKSQMRQSGKIHERKGSTNEVHRTELAAIMLAGPAIQPGSFFIVFSLPAAILAF